MQNKYPFLLFGWSLAILFSITLYHTDMAWLFYSCWICLGSYSLLKLYAYLPNKIKFLQMCLLGSLGFISLQPIIYSLEFWGDEIGVIEIARKSFAEVAPLAQNIHAAVPPLDYQNLHVWLKLTANIPLTYREFIWRVPYMLYHCIASALFAQLLVLLTDKKKGGTIIVWLGWLLFYTHPLGIEYALDIRFYALSLLSSVILLFGLLRNIYTKNWWLALVLLLGLNSIPFLIMTWATFLLQTILSFSIKKDRKVFVQLLLLITVCLVFAVQMTKSESDLNYFSWQQYTVVIQGLKGMWWFVLAVCSAIFYWLATYKKAPKNITDIILSSTWFIGVMMLILILRPYDGIGLRTFLPALPHLLLMLMWLIMEHKKLTLLAVFLVILQLYSSITTIMDHSFLERKTVGIKPVCVNAKSNNQKILIVTQRTESAIENDWNYSFIAWYSKNYSVDVVFAQPKQVHNREYLREKYQIYNYDNLTANFSL